MKSPKTPKTPKAPKAPKINGRLNKTQEEYDGEVMEPEVNTDDYGDGAGHYSDDCQE